MTTAEMPNSSFKTRMRSAAIFAPVVLIILYFGGFGFAIMMAAAAAVAGYEWARMVQKKSPFPPSVVQMSAAAAGLGVIAAGMTGSAIVALWFVIALCFLIFAFNYAKNGPSLAELLPGLLYIVFAIQIMVWIRNGIADGLYHMLTLLFIVWASDISAYITGRALGGPPLAPTISPKKTLTGFMGSSIGAGIVAAALATPWVLAKTGATTIGGFSYPGYYFLGFFLAMVGQAGDLLVSYFKRQYGVKDTGALIPGHGGILDRMDALLLVAIVFGALLILFR